MLSAGFSYFIHSEDWLQFGVIAFLTTYSIYNFQRIVKFSEATIASRHMVWVSKHRTLIIISSFLASIIGGIFLFIIINWSPRIFLLGGLGLLVSFFYIVRVGRVNLRELPFIKIHLIALSWVFMVAILPLLNEDASMKSLWFFGAIHYLYIIAVTIPFDIRDMSFDAKFQRTIPQVFGIRYAKLIALLCLIGFYFLSIYQIPSLGYNLLFLVAISLQLVLILNTNKIQSEFYASGWIEGSIFLLGIAYFC